MKWGLCGSAAQVIINTKGPFSLSLLLPFFCPTIYWLLLSSSPVSSHCTEPGKWRLYILGERIAPRLHPIQLGTETSALIPQETPEGRATVQKTDEPAWAQHYSRVALCCCWLSGLVSTSLRSSALCPAMLHWMLRMPRMLRVLLLPQWFLQTSSLSPVSWLSGWCVKPFCNFGSPCINKVVTFLLKNTVRSLLQFQVLQCLHKVPKLDYSKPSVVISCLTKAIQDTIDLEVSHLRR